MQDAELIREFVEEAVSHVDVVEVGLLKLEEGGGDTDIINNIFRAVHSVKGTAGFFNLKNIVNLSHAMENLLGEVRNGKLKVKNEMVDVLLAANDSLKNLIIDVENSDNIDISGHLANISANMSGHAGAGRQIEVINERMSVNEQPDEEVIIADGRESAILDAVERGQRVFKISHKIDKEVALNYDLPADFIKKIESIGRLIGYADNDFLITTVLEKSLAALALDIPEENIIELDVNDGLDELARLMDKGSNSSQTEKNACQPDVRPALPEQADFDAATASPAAAGLPVSDGAPDGTKKQQVVSIEDTIRVNVSLLNDLLNLVSEMVLGRNQLLRILGAYRKEITGLNVLLQNIDSITTELQEKIMQTRMQPVAKVFNKFPRIIRELSKKMGKVIELRMEGIDVELDKSIIEALGDPLTHLVRNAVDHGVETPDVREKAGKSRAGVIILKAYHEGGHVNIDIIDDGAGINVEIVKKKALQNGLISPSEASQMGERDLLALLFRPGFSTAENVTDLSGRGVGMDVVKTNIEKLGGVMEIMTKPGLGATFRLILPLTLAIIPSLIVEVAGQKFALPQVNLQEMVRIKPGDFSRKIEMIRDSWVMRLRGKLLPIVHLADVLGLPRFFDPNQVIRTLVIKSGSKRFGLIVDLIHDGEEILVKHLPRYLNDCQCYSGVTILGDGKTAMILDPEGISNKAGLRFINENQEKSAVDAYAKSMNERQNLLLFKCSGSETFSIDLSMVARVEKIQSDQIERIGDKEFIQFRGEALRLIRPEDYLPVTRVEKSNQTLFVIIPKLVRHPMGILIEKIYDTIEATIQFDREDVKAKGLVGSAILNNRIVLIINIYELFETASPEHYQPGDGMLETEKKQTVLLVEDTPFFIKMEKKYLEWAGYHVLTAYNGKEAWETLQENHVDVVVSDIEMPVMDGYELVSRVRADSRFARLPVVAVTSKADNRSIKRGMDAGFDYYEIKLDKEKLLKKVKLALEKGNKVV
ncbi:chemotaxis protein CheW [Pelotomaculum sp. PtaB.Bin117]|uniref:hybrid sensor histidine kinase/response regulator n=1 Tax=Pelotomaculum sp. PtaB.Bin117 TaxID=1811694 RepID=UPI0009CEF838|nr:chemotaxis protein CheW [Pelotomaculum sp. PtaB.Bin117]OPX88726.1 MAG: Chemotaxis protein CheA [Pelotomaculum sp. PtaB.Bin117]